MKSFSASVFLQFWECDTFFQWILRWGSWCAQCFKWLKMSHKVSWTKKYLGVQSWKAAHLPTLEFRVEQEGIVPASNNLGGNWGHWGQLHKSFVKTIKGSKTKAYTETSFIQILRFWPSSPLRFRSRDSSMPSSYPQGCTFEPGRRR